MALISFLQHMQAAVHMCNIKPVFLIVCVRVCMDGWDINVFAQIFS